MCGITGWIRDGATADVVARMTRALAHRGPDDELVIQRPGAALGARRLAIRGRAGGAQPLGRDGVWAQLNGEIYNDRELSEELGVQTSCDTELLLHLYAAYGDGFVERLSGMFALAVWDEPRRRLLLARDPMGKRPLYLACAGGGLVYGSELRALRQHPDVQARLSLVALKKYLLHDAVPAPATIFEDITKLEPGELATWEDQRLQRRVYWRPRFDAIVPSRPGQALDALEERVVAATRRRYAREVEHGFLLSGGVDSALVCAIAAADHRPRTFSLGWEEAGFDESGEAREVAQALGTDHHEWVVSDSEATAQVPSILAHVDEPLADESVIASWFVSRLAREHVTVALTGEGGDELFLGYPTFLADRVATALDRTGLSRGAGLLARAAGLLPATTGQVRLDFAAQAFARGLPFDRFARHATWLASVGPELQPRILSRAVQDATRDTYLLGDVRREVRAISPAARDGWDVLGWLYLRLFLADLILVKADRSAMAHALETRAPLLDRDVVALATALPRRLKLRGTSGKWILRRLAQRRGLPAAIAWRKKRGFSAPNASWLRGPLRSWMESLLAPDALSASGLFDPDAVSTLISEHVQGRRNHRKPLWALLAFRVWEERWHAD